MRRYFAALIVLMSLFLNPSIAQNFDKTYNETFFNQLEIQSDGYLLHFERPLTRTETNSVKQLKTDFEGNLIYVQNDTFPLPPESDFYFLTEPIWIDPSVPYQYREYEQYAVKKIEVRTNQVVWEAPIDLGFRYRIMEVQLNGGGPTVSVYEGLENTFVTTHTSPARHCCPNNFKFTKLDVEGNVVFFNKYDSIPSPTLNNVIIGAGLLFEASDGSSYFSVTRFNSPDFKRNILKLDSNGNVLWERSINAYQPDIIAPSGGIELSDNNLLFIASKVDGFYAIKTDIDGNELVTFEYIGNSATLQDFKETPDEGLIFLGGVDAKTFLVKIDSDFQTTLSDKIDLQLTSAKSSLLYKIYNPFKYELTVSNTSNQDATGIEIDVPQPVEAIYQGGNEYSATSGRFTTWGDNIWYIDRLPKGESVTLTINYFLMSEDDFDCYAQIIKANEQDVDSSPANGVCCDTANEDDESTIGIFPRKLLPDLYTSFFTFDDPLFPGTIANYRVSINNGGFIAAVGDFTLGVYISEDTELSNDDLRVGWINTGNLPTGFSEVVPGAVTIPDNLLPGRYFLLLVMDEGDLIEEQSEDNNIDWRRITVEEMFNSDVQSRQAEKNNVQLPFLSLKKVFPSPALDDVNIEILALKEQNIEIQIYDLMGRMNHSEKVNLRVGINTSQIDISALPYGQYSISIYPFHPYIRNGRFVKMRD